MDMRTNDAAWLHLKLDALATVAEVRAFGMPFPPAGAEQADGQAVAGGGLPAMAGKACPGCGNHTLIHQDGCEFCTACGYVGQCG